MRPLALVALLLVAGCAAPGPAGLPDAVAVLGDSISRAQALSANATGDSPQSSWATGGNATDVVTSHLERLRALQPGREVVGFNNAKGGAPIADLRGQAVAAVRQGAPYVLVMFGANDACARTTEAMTSEADFRARLREGLDVLRGLPAGARVYLVSVPDLTQLLDVFPANATARAMWSAFGTCQSAVGPAGPEPVRARIAAYNRALEEEAHARGYAWDGGRVTAMRFAEEDVSDHDYFHPSAHGQAKLANVTWEAGPFSDRDE